MEIKTATSAIGRSAWVTTAVQTAHPLVIIQDSELHTPYFKKIKKRDSPLLSFQTSFLFIADSDAKPSINL